MLFCELSVYRLVFWCLSPSYHHHHHHVMMRLTSQNCSLYRPIHIRVIVMLSMVWWYRLGLTPNLTTRALWQPPVLYGGPVSRDISGASRRMGEGNEDLDYPSPWDLKRSFTCRKILRHGISGFTSHPKKVVLRIFIDLKNPSSWPGSNPVTFETSVKHTNHYTT
jgi:hypothetical protein